MSAAPATTDATALLVHRLVGATDAPRRLLVLAHGVGGNEGDLAPLAGMAPADTTVAFVRAPLTLGVGRYAWFPVEFTAEGPRPDLGAAEASRLRLIAFVAALQARLGVPPERTVVAGFSQGGIISASLGLTRPDRVAGFGVLAGRILPELEPRLASRGALAGLRAFVGHGTQDAKLPVAWAQRAHDWLDALGIAHELRLYPAGHELPPPMREDFLRWFDATIATAMPPPHVSAAPASV